MFQAGHDASVHATSETCQDAGQIASDDVSSMIPPLELTHALCSATKITEMPW